MQSIKNITCSGAGYVGGPTTSVIAQKNPEINVTVVDLNTERVAPWNDSDLSILPIYGPALDKVGCEARGPHLLFSADVEQAIDQVDTIFSSVNTSTITYGKG